MDSFQELPFGKESLSVCIVGPQQLFNELLAKAVEDALQVNCRFCQSLPLVPPLDANQTADCLILFDCFCQSSDSLWKHLESWRFWGQKSVFSVLFNVCVEMRGYIEKQCIRRGVRGIFFCDESLHQLLKGVKQLLRGELWFSRRILTECVKDPMNLPEHERTLPVDLTRREKEVLLFLYAGYGNNEIAEKLFVSLHTVRTHLYNLYKKLGVSSRLQAAMWAANHFNLLQ